ncbi:MAG TPA: flagellar biosynthesis protein FlhB [Lachnospiraceae bacterium]|nr:EscU/YscU/HrcU family type III secretion system export apparatus switch protein [uncultured Lachnoclostridium sp.]HAU84152.1 flagellar biosynthesis protein FlhB [Lachnospiraceae bacterium]
MGSIFDKKKAAVALTYEKGDSAPKVVATGRGYVADKIIETAVEHDVPIHEDKKLAESLSTLEIGDTIPQELYEVVAEILVFVSDMEKIKERIK